MFLSTPLPRTLAAALRDASDPKENVRASALRDLVAHADEERTTVVPRLVQALRDDSAKVRKQAVLALADVHAVEALASLLFAVEDGDVEVRQMALLALGEIGDLRAGERLRRALSDERPEVRFQAVIAFSRVAPDDAVAALETATHDADPMVRHIALRVGEEHAGTRGEAVASALLVRARALLADAEARVRTAAAIVLAGAGDQAGADVLVDVVAGKTSTPDAEDEAAAVELVGQLRLARAIPMLERRAFGAARWFSNTFAFQARVSLARMGHPRARREILSDLAGWSRHRRTIAVAAAGHARLREALPLIRAMRGKDERAEQSAVLGALSSLGDEQPEELASVG